MSNGEELVDLGGEPEEKGEALGVGVEAPWAPILKQLVGEGVGREEVPAARRAGECEEEALGAQAMTTPILVYGLASDIASVLVGGRAMERLVGQERNKAPGLERRRAAAVSDRAALGSLFMVLVLGNVGPSVDPCSVPIKDVIFLVLFGYFG
ncbi:unnamed protein product [Ilex paraguariensis]|uniref:Uncharacterized protein n=1 Tax=Ilex paraguariensis TaxID=185542 RepID=A0ABC8TDX8_9AQUA